MSRNGFPAERSQRSTDQDNPRGRGSRPAPLLRIVIAVAVAVWSLMAWIGYNAADPVVAWLGSIVLGVIENGQGVAEAFGGKPAGEVVKALDGGGLAGQILALVQIIIKPAIVVIWALGIVALMMLPLLASLGRRIIGRFQ